jgi:mono/diheme cytochrome c family protein
MKAYCWFLTAAFAGPLVAAPTAEQIEFFESRIRPVLAQECYECHSAEGKQKGGLLLDSRPGWQAGGDSGDVIKPGNPAESLLIASIRHAHDDLKMPKNGAKLDDEVIADFEKWIADGAPDPRDAPPDKAQLAKETDWDAVLQRRKQWWCFQPVSTQPPLTEKAIDAYLDAKLQEAGLNPAPMADARTVIRRVSYILTGLPPSPEEVAAFEKAAATHRQQALENLVERLLSSPRYGERWARHWMDWVRYAESYGSEGDPAIPYAWRYRDYLIRAFNEDVAYPQLLREAIAGDLLAKPRINKELGINESALGTAHLRMVLHGFSPTDSLDEMVTFTDNQIDTVTKAFQALTVSCARCHNHKFDAISQADFYALYGIFTSTHPAVIDVNAPGTGEKERPELRKLKNDIKQAVGAAWVKAAEALPATPEKDQPDPIPAAKRWDLRKEPWFSDGNGVKQGATKPGEFSIATEGDNIIARIYPGGVFSDLISTKDRGVINSPRFKCEGGTLWFRAAGGGGARARYVVQNYPRTGTIHKAKDLTGDNDATLGWHKLDLNYWKGDEIFLQCNTSSDMPAEAKPDQRSWFGITEAFITHTDQAPPSFVISGDPREAVAAWLAGSMTDVQAELLAALLRQGKLPNDRKSLPEAAALLARYREVEARLPAPTRAPGVLEAEGSDATLFVRGDHKQPAQTVPRRFLDGINPAAYQTSNSGRLELARSLTDPQNPLTSRVIANRLWHHVFGRGIVGTPDNFGRLGEKPTHPELLDALAAHFTKSGGSMKETIRLLVTSQAFQRGSQPPAASAKVDPENKLLSHWTVRRLEAEAIRDSILSLSGRLEPAMYGEPDGANSGRRSVYVSIIRNSLPPFLTAFDMPVPFSTRGRRDVTNVPAQSLALLNDPFVTSWSSSWARVAANAESDVASRVRLMFAQALGREPSAAELQASLAFVKESAGAGQQQERELKELDHQIASLEKQVAAKLDPARAALTRQRPTNSIADAPNPFAEWDFEKDGRDLVGNLHLKLEGGARVEQGALVLDGRDDVARSVPLPKEFKSKTFEAWVLLDDLDQRGGGVMTMQDKRGVVFDSIVFAEKDAKQWLAGSDHFSRTQSFNGSPDQEAAKRPVHIAIVYDGGKVTGYRDGVFYGKGYKVDEPAVFKKGESEILLGCRHGAPGGNRSLRGRILRARLYDRALRPDDITASRQVEATAVTESDVLDALTSADRTQVRQWQTELEKLNGQAAALRQRVERFSPATAGWESLALSLINLKEFLYLR